jgi:hypothetical protein
MRRTSRRIAGTLLAAVTVGVAGCRDELPTFSGDFFPGTQRTQTLELQLPLGDFLLGDTVFQGFTDARTLGALLTANGFGEAGAGPQLHAHALTAFQFPDTVQYVRDGTVYGDTVFSLTEATLVGVIDPLRSVYDQAVELQLWEAAEAWDTLATWHLARGAAGEQQAWTEPGGTRGALLASLMLTPGDTLPGDTLRWALDSVAVNRLAGAHGLVVTAAGAPSRIQFGFTRLDVSITPTSIDTTLVQTLVPRALHYVFNPPFERPAGLWSVGGVRSYRTVLQLQLPDHLPACADPAGPGPCPTIPLGQVQLNQLAVLLTPHVQPDGYRVVSPVRLEARLITEPELGARAPLGPSVGSSESIPADAFARGDTTAALFLGPAFARRLVADTARTGTIALTIEPEGRTFGVARFHRDARLRIIYTIVPEPTLP